MTIRHIFFVLFVFFVVNLSAQVELRWDAQVERPSAYDATVFRGETVTLMPRLVRGVIPADLAGSTATLYWQTNGMGAAWWSKPAAVSATDTGRVEAVFAPTNDFGAARYTWFIRTAGDSGAAYRAFGSLVMRDSPGYSPTAAPPAVYQWASPADMLALSNALASGAVQLVAAEALLRVTGDAARPTHAAATNLVAAMVPTLTVAEARRLVAADSNSWVTVENGTNWLYQIVDGDDVYVSAVAEYSGDPQVDGPPIGTLWQREPGGGWAAADGWLLYYVGEGFDSWYIQAEWKLLSVAGPPEVLPVTLQPTAPTAGSPTIDWVPITNRVQIATQTGTVILISEHDGDPGSHPTLPRYESVTGIVSAAVSEIPRVPTNAVTGWRTFDYGSNAWVNVVITNLEFYVEIEP